MSKRWIRTDYRTVLKGLLLVAACIALPVIAWAQWTTSGNDVYNTNSGNVAIGVSGGGARLVVCATASCTSGNAIQVGNDVVLADLDTANTMGIYGTIDSAIASIKLGTGGGTLSGYSGNIGIGTTSPATKLQLQAEHGNTQFRLFSDQYGQGLSGANTSNLNLWASEPGWTWTGAGIGNNIINYLGAPYQRVTNTRGGSYIRLLDNSLYFNVVDSSGTDRSGIAVSGSGNVGIGTVSPSSKLDVNGDVTVSGNISAKYQDFAEWVPAVHPIAPGTVVILDPQIINTVMPSTEAYDTRVAGVVSAAPGIVLGEAGESKVRVATTGRVRVLVDATRGPIRIGDLLVTSDKEGVAMRSDPIEFAGRKIHQPGTLIGKALEPLNDGEGEILVLLSLQ